MYFDQISANIQTLGVVKKRENQKMRWVKFSSLSHKEKILETLAARGAMHFIKEIGLHLSSFEGDSVSQKTSKKKKKGFQGDS